MYQRGDVLQARCTYSFYFNKPPHSDSVKLDLIVLSSFSSFLLWMYVCVVNICQEVKYKLDFMSKKAAFLRFGKEFILFINHCLFLDYFTSLCHVSMNE